MEVRLELEECPCFVKQCTGKQYTFLRRDEEGQFDGQYQWGLPGIATVVEVDKGRLPGKQPCSSPQSASRPRAPAQHRLVCTPLELTDVVLCRSKELADLCIVCVITAIAACIYIICDSTV
ncbi:hypothetical protein J6590_039045 [Homalodisca vitripennis]|nr:hypothetical protein J6590_039045 [Homalodisca vitripennis]